MQSLRHVRYRRLRCAIIAMCDRCNIVKLRCAIVAILRSLKRRKKKQEQAVKGANTKCSDSYSAPQPTPPLHLRWRVSPSGWWTYVPLE